ncbi:MAG: D-aminoacyl-tRNA deacylase [Schleiferiaceae bacterium]|nr:D-aminoacyl-tRNA deacylase [Schleiferiaceae bacterium]
MRALLQRVSQASVTVNGKVQNAINSGLLIFLGVEPEDTEADANWLSSKIAKMRLFPDSEGVMNDSIMDAQGEFLVISQFTLHASVKKGNRPSYYKAARPSHAEPMYEHFMEQLWMDSGLVVKSGTFGADMKVGLINDGPITIWMDSKNKE